MTALQHYILAVLRDGDWMNDWLTHLCPAIRSIVMFIGWLLAILTGA